MSQATPLRFPFANPEPLQPPAEWAELREKCPVAHVTLPSGDAALLVTRYDDVKQVLADPRFPRSGEGAARQADTESGGCSTPRWPRPCRSGATTISSGAG